MEDVLIVSPTEKSMMFFTDALAEHPYNGVFTAHSCGEARRFMNEREFDLCIINAPMSDEYGRSLAMDISSGGFCQVILIVKHDVYDAITRDFDETGVFTLSKPMNQEHFKNAVKLTHAVYHKLMLLQNQNRKLLQKIDDIRMIDRAKCVLIEYLRMTEQEAHKYIEKQAMDMRVTRKIVAENILKTYES
jgi:response regulator NasT